MYKQKLNPKICLKDGLEDFKSFNFGTQEDLSVVFPPPKKKDRTERPNFSKLFLQYLGESCDFRHLVVFREWL